MRRAILLLGCLLRRQRCRPSMAGGHVNFRKSRQRWLASTGQMCAALLVLMSVGGMARPAAATNTSSPTTETWTGASTVDNNWTTGANWADGTAPAPGSDLVFPDVASTCNARDD